MKKTITILLGLVVLGGLLLTQSCEGPEGPAGTPGADGTDGTDGVDGNASCLECHTDVKMTAISDAFAETNHGSGTSFAYAGARGYCNPCHDHESYVTFVSTGVMTTGLGMNLECGTCHDDHASLEDDIDAPVRTVEAVASLAYEGTTYDHGTGNLCATCHQARTPPEAYDEYTAATTAQVTFDSTNEGDLEDLEYYRAAYIAGTLPGAIDTSWVDTDYIITFDIPATNVFTSSTHAGPHHGPQANLFAADIGTASGEPFDRDHHTNCSSCHLNDTTATTGYGHNFTADIGQCDDCHGAALDITADQLAIQTRLDAIRSKLEEIHAIHVDDEGGVHPLYASLPRDQWNAFWNYMVLYEDNSKGVHNFGYTRQLLTAAEDALEL